MSLDSVEQELFDFGWGALPPWYKARERAAEEVAMFAKIMGSCKKQVAYWLSQSLIGTATGPAGNDPDWLEWHAEESRHAKVSRGD